MVNLGKTETNFCLVFLVARMREKDLYLHLHPD